MHYSQFYPKILDRQEREKRAPQILAILKQYFSHRKDTKRLKLLDIGCSDGTITHVLSRYFGETIGIDIDTKAIARAEKNYSGKGLKFRILDAQYMPFKGKSLDVIICNQVYYYLSNSHQLVSEIYRVLRPGGICYFSGMNKWIWRDVDLKLPLSTILPRSTSKFYAKVMGKNPHYVNHYLSYFELKKLFHRFNVHDYTASIIKSRYPVIFRSTPIWFINRLIFLSPNFIFILEKPNS